MIVGAALAISLPVAATPILVVLTIDPPDGILAGQAGTAVGWGFTLTVNDGSYVTIESVNFTENGTPIGTFSTPGLPSGSATLGAPTIAPWFIDSSGLQYDIFNGAGLAAFTQGTLTLIYDTFSDVGLTDQTGFADSVNATFGGNDVVAQVTVNQEAAITPEPAGIWLMGAGIGLVAAMRRRSLRSRV